MGRVDDAYLDLLKTRYRKASKKEKGGILDEFVKTTQYHRDHASALLSGRYTRAKEPIRRPRRAIYGDREAQALLLLSDLFDGASSKRLRSAMDVELPRLYEKGSVPISQECYQLLMKVSPATIDRLLKGRRPRGRKLRGFTKPGTLLKDRIPVRTWADWSEDRPGFCEMDLVDHSGGRTIPGADSAWTLSFTDIKTCWTECVGVRNKAQVHVFAAIQLARRRLPFPLLGVDSDNGSEFINDQLDRYCFQEQITFTRGRVGRRNDSAHVEQKNSSVVRRAVGYRRYDTPSQLDLLNRLYSVMHYYVNFFLPSVKLQTKTRIGSKVKKTYDKPQTPYARSLLSPDLSDHDKDLLRETYALLDLVELRQQIDKLQAQLLKSKSAL
jgi:hypothetical protein